MNETRVVLPSYWFNGTVLLSVDPSGATFTDFLFLFFCAFFPIFLLSSLLFRSVMGWKWRAMMGRCGAFPFWHRPLHSIRLLQFNANKLKSRDCLVETNPPPTTPHPTNTTIDASTPMPKLFAVALQRQNQHHHHLHLPTHLPFKKIDTNPNQMRIWFDGRVIDASAPMPKLLAVALQRQNQHHHHLHLPTHLPLKIIDTNEDLIRWTGNWRFNTNAEPISSGATSTRLRPSLFFVFCFFYRVMNNEPHDRK